MSPTLGLLASIAAILVLLRLKQHPGLAVFAGSLVIALLLLPATSVPRLLGNTLANHQFLRLVCIVAAALTLSRLMELKGMLNRLATTLEAIGPKFAMLLVPSVIGLVPMPGGALVSATALKDLVRRIGLKPGQATFINYWFRHIWELSLPVYPAVITTSVVLSMPLSSVFLALLPLTAGAAVLGIVSSRAVLRDTGIGATSETPGKGIALDFLRAAWPVLLLVVLVVSGLKAVIAFPLALGFCALQQRPARSEVMQSLKYGLEPKVILLLFAVMLYKGTVETTGAATTLLSDMRTAGTPPLLILIALPLVIGFATGLSLPSVGIAFPLLLPFIAPSSGVDSQALLVAFTAGATGYLISPLHLCLVLSTEYFGARLLSVYRYILPPLLLLGSIIVLVYVL